MIIECKNCLEKFTVKDSDIPIKGRTVQCGNCSTQWFQMPILPAVKTSMLDPKKDISKISSSVAANNLEIEDDVSHDLSEKAFMTSDGKNYKFLGSQWAEVLPSGKSGRLARKKISKELNKLAGRKQVKKIKTIQKSKLPANQYQETEGGIGVFSFLIVLVIFVAAIILLLDTFKHQLVPFFPKLDNYLVYIFETFNNIYIIIKDLFNNYK
jgi:predicted Zn finger-like uncharacterized protein|tara:strand:+ start:568 stop:1200 length:633 start_codon:yes stop_codon:yes gene_type:complete